MASDEIREFQAWEVRESEAWLAANGGNLIRALRSRVRLGSGWNYICEWLLCQIIASQMNELGSVEEEANRVFELMAIQGRLRYWLEKLVKHATVPEWLLRDMQAMWPEDPYLAERLAELGEKEDPANVEV